MAGAGAWLGTTGLSYREAQQKARSERIVLQWGHPGSRFQRRYSVRVVGEAMCFRCYLKAYFNGSGGDGV